MEFYEFESRLARPVKVKIPDFQSGERLNHIVFADQFTTSTIDGVVVSKGAMATGGVAVFHVDDHMLMVIGQFTE